jgi:hypothetical protein
VGLAGHLPEYIGNFPVVTTSPAPSFPVGIADVAEPSGYAPPGAGDLPGYQLLYVSDFNGSSLPSGWSVFTGVPSGDRSGQFAASHVVVSDGVVHLNTWRDARYDNKWVTGGMCQCGVARTYGAYFVRSRNTGPGPNEVQLLWPTSNVWPPEIDFNETGDLHTATSWTVHWSSANLIDQRSLIIDMSRWHTWGVIWSRSAIIFTVDGHEWGRFTTTRDIPDVPMRLDLEQLAFCQSGHFCPTKPVSMDINWVAEYSATTASRAR